MKMRTQRGRDRRYGMNGARFKLTALVLLWLTLHAGAHAVAAPLKILAFGTSLTQSFGVPPGMELPAILQAKLDAVNKQLGLKLEMQKRPLPVLVIDHVEEKPTDN